MPVKNPGGFNRPLTREEVRSLIERIETRLLQSGGRIVLARILAQRTSKFSRAELVAVRDAVADCLRDLAVVRADLMNLVPDDEG